MRFRQWFTALLQEVFGWQSEPELAETVELAEHTDRYTDPNAISWIDQVFSCLVYSDSLARSIKAWKYEWADSARTFSNYVSQGAKRIPNRKSIRCIAWVPIGINRYFERGFNQSKILATAVSKELWASTFPHLYSFWSIGHQARRNKKDRETSRKTFFTIPNRKSKAGGTVLLVDDVISTGSTVLECAKALKNAGFSRVIVLALARSDV